MIAFRRTDIGRFRVFFWGGGYVPVSGEAGTCQCNDLTSVCIVYYRVVYVQNNESDFPGPFLVHFPGLSTTTYVHFPCLSSTV